MTKATKELQMMVGRFDVKQADADTRVFEGDLSTSHLDLGNGYERDVVHPGAFKRTLDHFEHAEDPYIPLLDTHDRFSILSVFGHMLEGEERLTGETLEYELEDDEVLEVDEMVLRTKWKVIDGADGDRILNRLRPGSVRQMSMGYRPVEWDHQTLKDGTPLRNLREVMLREGSLVVFGMNPNAEVDLATVKSMISRWETDPGKADPEVVRQLHERLGALLKEPDTASDRLATERLEELQAKLDQVRVDRLATRLDAARRSSSPVLTSL